MAISLSNAIRKMRNWEPVVCQTKTNANRQDLWELIETKPDFFEKSDKYIKTGLNEMEKYPRASQPEFLTKPVDMDNMV